MKCVRKLVAHFSNSIVKTETKPKVPCETGKFTTSIKNINNEEIISQYEKKEIKDFIDKSWKELQIMELKKKQLSFSSQNKKKMSKHSTEKSILIRDTEKKTTRNNKNLNYTPSVAIYSKTELELLKEQTMKRAEGAAIVSMQLENLKNKERQYKHEFLSETETINEKLAKISARMESAKSKHESTMFERVFVMIHGNKATEKITDYMIKQDVIRKLNKEKEYLKTAKLIEDHKLKKEKNLKEIKKKTTKELEKRRQLQAMNYNKVKNKNEKELEEILINLEKKALNSVIL